MAQLNAEIFKANYPEIWQEIYNKGFAAGEAKNKALIEVYRDRLLEIERKQKPSGDQSVENKRIIESMVPKP
jgi:phosphopantetheinyl transferase (holo-ACP synthase)